MRIMKLHREQIKLNLNSLLQVALQVILIIKYLIYDLTMTCNIHRTIFKCLAHSVIKTQCIQIKITCMNLYIC